MSCLNLSAAEALRRQTTRPAVLLLYGASDALAPPAESARFWASAFGYGPLPFEGLEGQDVAHTSVPSEDSAGPDLRAVIIEKAGHSVMLERPIEVNRVIWRFAKEFLGPTSEPLLNSRQTLLRPELSCDKTGPSKEL